MIAQKNYLQYLKNRPQPKDTSSLWLITFTDLLTLLLGFFILSYSMTMNKTSYEGISNILFPIKSKSAESIVVENSIIKKIDDLWVATLPYSENIELSFKEDETIRTIISTFPPDKFYFHIAGYFDEGISQNIAINKLIVLTSQLIDLGVKENTISSSKSPANYPPKYNIVNNSLLPSSRFDIIISRKKF